jgi:hypothetical protein
MTTRDRDPPDEERMLEALVDAADRTAEHDVLSHELPSFAAIVARAHRMEPGTVSADDVDYASGVHRVVPRPIGRSVPESDGDEIDLFVDAARAEAEDDVGAWERNGLPPLSRPATPRVRRAVTIVGALAAAAGLVLAIGWLQSWSALVLDRDREDHQALAGVDTQAEQHEATQVVDVDVDKPAPRRRAVKTDVGPPRAPESAFVVPEELAPLDPAAPVVAPAVEPGVASVPGRVAGTVPATAPRRSSRPAKSALARIEARAHAAVAKGDLREADRLYEEVIDRGGRSAVVELAYADRFTIARGGGDVKKRRALWREYLAKFPRGRFADDARAGLCRVESAAKKSACWAGYVADFPAGAYRSHAERWLPHAGGGAESVP